MGISAVTLFCLCLLLFVFAGVGGQQTQCEDRWFGDKCQYQCHCLNYAVCDKTTGECPDGCDRRWFGPQCQYWDAAFNASVYLTDGIESTCLIGSDLSQNFTMLNDVMFTWMRIVTNKPGMFENVNITFLTSSDDEVAPQSPLTEIYHNETTLYLYGELEDRFNTIRLDFDTPETRQSFCSMHVSSGRNVALKQNATQSSTWSFGDAQKAVDGNLAQEWRQRSCITTEAEDYPYWTLNLSLPVTVNVYTLFSRSENHAICRLRYFWLESYFESTEVQQYNETSPTDQYSYDVYPEDTSPITSVTITVSKDFWPNGKYYCNIGDPSLSFCEMQIYGEVVCEPGNWGRQCEKNCNCQDACFVSTGMCPSQCEAGFFGLECQKECADGQWGVDCLNYCDNCLGGQCNKSLSECDQGYKLPYCVEECDIGFHNYSCNQTCPENCLNNTCDPINGTCMRCESGYQGSICHQECADGQWGVDCLNYCDNCLGGQCNKSSGECLSECDQGYKLPYCVEECDIGFHNYSCNQTCPENCLNNRCDPINGTCMRCESGYQGSMCHQECEPMYYGEDCAATCSDTCIDQLCHHITGVCDNCPVGKQISVNCSEDCAPGFFGPECTNQCSELCGRDGSCNNINGSCLQGCKPGYRSDYCEQPCTNNTYGEGCNKTCSGNCVVNVTLEPAICEHVTGQCLLGCLSGYSGITCEEISSDSDNIFKLIIIIVPTVLGLIIVVAALIIGICCCRRKSPKDGRASLVVDEAGNSLGSELELENQPSKKQHPVVKEDAQVQSAVLNQKMTMGTGNALGELDEHFENIYEYLDEFDTDFVMKESPAYQHIYHREINLESQPSKEQVQAVKDDKISLDVKGHTKAKNEYGNLIGENTALKHTKAKNEYGNLIGENTALKEEDFKDKDKQNEVDLYEAIDPYEEPMAHTDDIGCDYLEPVTEPIYSNTL